MEPAVDFRNSNEVKLQKTQNFLTGIKNSISGFLHDNKINISFLFLFFLMPFVYELLSVFEDPKAYENYLITTKRYIVLDDYLTVHFQEWFGTTHTLIGISGAYFYTFGFLALSATASLMLGITIIRKKQFRRREPWVYIAVVLVMFVIDISGYWLFPSAPPVRVHPNLFYRKILFPSGDSLVTIKYNAIPSGHIYALAVPFIAAKAENYKSLRKIFALGLILISWDILLTGDHYSFDIYSAYFLTLIFFYAFTTTYDYFNKSSIKVSKEVVIARLKKILLIFLSLIFLSIVTFTYINSYFLIFQVFCIFVIWPIIILITPTEGILNGDAVINRSLTDDVKELFISFKRILDNAKA